MYFSYILTISSNYFHETLRFAAGIVTFLYLMVSRSCSIGTGNLDFLGHISLP